MPTNAHTGTGRPTNFKLGTQTEHEDPYQLSTAMASYKGLVKLGYCTWARSYHVSRTRDGHITYYLCHGGNVFTFVFWFVCLSVNEITQKVVD